MLSISNETDPDGKTKILTILNIKLPHWNGIDNFWVKVDDGPEANILPLDSFRTMFPHALDEHGYPTAGFLERSKINLECYNDGRLINHGCIKLKLQHYSEKSFQDHNFYIVETKTWKEIIIGHPVSVKVRSHSCVMQECLQVHFSRRKQWEYQLQQLLSRPLTKYWQANHDRGSKEVNLSPSKTIHQNLSGPQPKMHNLRLLSRPLTKTQVKVSFQDHLPKGAKMNHIWLLSRPQAHKVRKWQVLSRPQRMDPKSWLLSRP